ncbi:N-acetyltransferase, partial [Streptomyces anulatus]
MITIRTARDADLDGFLNLASEVEHWFGPMVEEPGVGRAGGGPQPGGGARGGACGPARRPPAGPALGGG